MSLDFSFKFIGIFYFNLDFISMFNPIFQSSILPFIALFLYCNIFSLHGKEVQYNKLTRVFKCQNQQKR